MKSAAFHMSRLFFTLSFSVELVPLLAKKVRLLKQLDTILLFCHSVSQQTKKSNTLDTGTKQ